MVGPGAGVRRGLDPLCGIPRTVAVPEVPESWAGMGARAEQVAHGAGGAGGPASARRRGWGPPPGKWPTAPAGQGPRFGEEAGMGAPAGQKHCRRVPVRFG
jgi:hypothetical protein